MIYQRVPETDYQEKEARAVSQFAALLAQGQGIALRKNVKHIFKERDKKPNLDLRHFNQVISIDTDARIATVEGMTTFYDLVEATLAYGLMPQAVPELRSITVGGAVAGLGGQSSSFKFGLIHEMITDFELLTGEGKVIHCSPETHGDIFHMLPNSYGSLGYILRCSIKLNRVLPYVKLQVRRFQAAEGFFTAMFMDMKGEEADFVEGVSFSPADYALLTGIFSEDLPPGRKALIPLQEPFFKSIQDPTEDVRYLSIRDYIWRWDPDAFWATDQKNILGSILLNPLFRRTIGPAILRSDRLVKIGQFRNRLRKKGVAKYLFLEQKHLEALIQDAAIPSDAAAEFNAWLAKQLQIFPLWYCPVKTVMPAGTYPLYEPRSEYVVDFGFYVSMELEDDMEPNHYNLQIEQKLVEVGGFKCLYSDTFFSQDQFWSFYDREKYEQVKTKYDPHNTYRDLYDKVVNQSY